MSQAACPGGQFITLRFQQFWDLRAEAEVGSEVGDEDPIPKVLITGVGGRHLIIVLIDADTFTGRLHNWLADCSGKAAVWDKEPQ